MENRLVKKEQERLGEDQLLIKWLREERKDLVAQVSAAKPKSPALVIFSEWVVPAVKVLFFAVCANPREFDGHFYVTGESKRHAALTSKVVSGATLLNAITNWPILFYTFRFVGTVPAIVFSTALNFVILWWTNQTGTTAASRKHGNAMWSSAGVAAFLAMSMVQSVVAGIGSELINNQEGLSYIKAEELAREHIERLKDIKQDFVDKKTAVEEMCTNIDSDQEYIDAFGTTYQRRIAGNFPNPNAPCAPLQRYRYDNQISEAEQRVEVARAEHLETSNDIIFLQNIQNRPNGPQTYKQYFHEEVVDGRTIPVLNSGAEAILIASDNFFSGFGFNNGKVVINQEAANASTAFFVLSIITSLSASFLIMAHSFKQETKMSHSHTIKDSVIWWLESMRQKYAQRMGYQESDDDEKLLALFIRDYRENGECNYPKVQAIINMSQAGMDLRLIGDGEKLLKEVSSAYETVDTASSFLYDYLEDLRCQKVERKANLRAAWENTVDFFMGESTIEPNKKPVSKDERDSVKENLSNLRQGVTCLISLSNRYAAGTSLDGKKKYSKEIKRLEEQLAKKMQIVKTAPYSALSQDEIKTDKNKYVSELQSQLIQIQGDCSDLKEIAKEEIKNKLIPLFVECENDLEA